MIPVACTSGVSLGRPRAKRRATRDLARALLAWLDIRARGGRFVVRLENLDRLRCRPAWSAPMLLFRLYRNQKDCARKRQPYRKKTELAREMLDVFHSWVGDDRVELASDAAYCNDTVTRGLSASFVLFGAMRPDAVLTELPHERGATTRGRRRRRGELLPKPEQIARDECQPWHTCEAFLYGRQRKVRYKEVFAQW